MNPSPAAAAGAHKQEAGAEWGHEPRHSSVGREHHNAGCSIIFNSVRLETTLPAQAAGKAADDDPGASGRPGWSSWLLPGADLALVAIWEVNLQMEDFFLFLSLSFKYMSNPYKVKCHCQSS